MGVPLVTVPPPPSPFTPLTYTLPAGTTLFRSHWKTLPATRFIQYKKPGTTRFGPFTGAAGTTLGVLYVGQTDEAAVCESVLHHIPASGGVVGRSDYEDRILTELTIDREVKLASFLGKGLRHLGVDAHELTGPEADDYSLTVKWAEAAYQAGFDGIAWMSARLNSDRAYVLFEDRVSPADFTAVGALSFDPDLDSVDGGFTWLSAFCQQVNVTVTI